MSKLTELAEDWEYFLDESYFDMWCVRPVGSRKFGDGFHLVSEEGGKALCEYLNEIAAALRAMEESHEG